MLRTLNVHGDWRLNNTYNIMMMINNDYDMLIISISYYFDCFYDYYDVFNIITFEIIDVQ